MNDPNEALKDMRQALRYLEKAFGCDPRKLGSSRTNNEMIEVLWKVHDAAKDLEECLSVGHFPYYKNLFRKIEVRN